MLKSNEIIIAKGSLSEQIILGKLVKFHSYNYHGINIYSKALLIFYLLMHLNKTIQ